MILQAVEYISIQRVLLSLKDVEISFSTVIQICSTLLHSLQSVLFSVFSLLTKPSRTTYPLVLIFGRPPMRNDRRHLFKISMILSQRFRNQVQTGDSQRRTIEQIGRLLRKTRRCGVAARAESRCGRGNIQDEGNENEEKLETLPQIFLSSCSCLRTYFERVLQLRGSLFPPDRILINRFLE